MRSEVEDTLADIVEDMQQITFGADHPNGGMFRKLAQRALQERLDERAAIVAFLEYKFGDNHRVVQAIKDLLAGVHNQ